MCLLGAEELARKSPCLGGDRRGQAWQLGRAVPSPEKEEAGFKDSGCREVWWGLLLQPVPYPVSSCMFSKTEKRFGVKKSQVRIVILVMKYSG